MFKWTVLPFTQTVVDIIEELAESNEEDIVLTDRNGNVIEDEEENKDYESEEEDNDECVSEEDDINERDILDTVRNNNNDENDSMQQEAEN